MASAASISRALNEKFGKGAFTVRAVNGRLGGITVVGDGLPASQAQRYLIDLGFRVAAAKQPGVLHVGSRKIAR